MEFKNNINNRQFILGPKFVNSLENWQKINIANNYFLTAHPSLDVNSVKHDNFSLTMLGFVLDYENPKDNNIEILFKLIKKIKIKDVIFDLTKKFCGRYIFIFSDYKGAWIFNDTTGLRQIVYTMGTIKESWVSSQADLIADLLELEQEKKYLKEFFYTPNIIKNLAQW